MFFFSQTFKNVNKLQCSHEGVTVSLCFSLPCVAAHGLTSTLVLLWERIFSFEMVLCVCVLEQWDLIKRKSKPDCLMHSSKQSQSNHPPAAACRSSQQIKTLMDIDQTPSNKPKAGVQSEPAFAFLTHKHLCVCASLTSIKNGRFLQTYVVTFLWMFEGKYEQRLNFSTVRSNKSSIIFLSHLAGLMSTWMTVVFHLAYQWQTSVSRPIMCTIWTTSSKTILESEQIAGREKARMNIFWKAKKGPLEF